MLLLNAIYCAVIATVPFGLTIDFGGGIQGIWRTFVIYYQRNPDILIHFFVAPVILILIALSALAALLQSTNRRTPVGILIWLGFIGSSTVAVWWLTIGNGPSPVIPAMLFFASAAMSITKDKKLLRVNTIDR